MKRVLRVCDSLIQTLAGQGMTLLFENVPDHSIREIGSEQMDFVELFRHYTLKEPIRMTIDSGHAQIMHQQDLLPEAFADRWAYTHINDNSGMEDSHLAPGMGKVNFDKLAKFAETNRYTGPLIMEYPFAGLDVGMNTVTRVFNRHHFALAAISTGSE